MSSHEGLWILIINKLLLWHKCLRLCIMTICCFQIFPLGNLMPTLALFTGSLQRFWFVGKTILLGLKILICLCFGCFSPRKSLIGLSSSSIWLWSVKRVYQNHCTFHPLCNSFWIMLELCQLLRIWQMSRHRLGMPRCINANIILTSTNRNGTFKLYSLTFMRIILWTPKVLLRL